MSPRGGGPGNGGPGSQGGGGRREGGGPGGGGPGRGDKDDDGKRKRDFFRETTEGMDAMLGFRVPRRRELDMRDRFMQLSRLSTEEIREQLYKWPPFKKLSLGEQGRLFMRIQEIKDKKKEIAMFHARFLNINLRPEQEEAFENSFWEKRLAMDRTLFQELEPRRRELEDKMRAELQSEFGPKSAVPPAPAPSAPATNTPARP